MTVDDAGAAGAAAEPPRRGSGRHRRDKPSTKRPAALAVLVVLCVFAGVACAGLWLTTPSDAPETLVSANAESALAAARSSVHTILSYDYRTIDTDIANAKADSTGVFAGQYAGTARRLLSEASQVKAIVQATVGSAGVVSASTDNVVILLFVDQASVRKTPGRAAPTTRIDQSRVRVTMTKVDGHWLVSDLAAL